MFYNQFGAPTHPTRSIADFMLLLQSSEAIASVFNFMAFGLEVNTDQVAGLDSYTS